MPRWLVTNSPEQAEKVLSQCDQQGLKFTFDLSYMHSRSSANRFKHLFINDLDLSPTCPFWSADILSQLLRNETHFVYNIMMIYDLGHNMEAHYLKTGRNSIFRSIFVFYFCWRKRNDIMMFSNAGDIVVILPVVSGEFITISELSVSAFSITTWPPIGLLLTSFRLNDTLFWSGDPG